MRVAIAGYGNIGKAVEKCVSLFDDISLFAVFTRRNPKTVGRSLHTVLPFSSLKNFQNEIDVVINCMDSYEDLPETTPMIAKMFNVIDSYNDHSNISEHFEKVNEICKRSATSAIISCGWDPGLLSLSKLLKACFPKNKDHSFCNSAAKQPRSDDLKSLYNVVDAKQYTLPAGSAVYRVKQGEMPDLAKDEKQKSGCYVVTAQSADEKKTKQRIRETLDAFNCHDSEFSFIDYEAFFNNLNEHIDYRKFIGCEKKETGVSSAKTSFKSASDFEVTAKILLCYARALDRMSKRRETGCFTVFDVKPSDLAFMSHREKLNVL